MPLPGRTQGEIPPPCFTRCRNDRLSKVAKKTRIYGLGAHCTAHANRESRTHRTSSDEFATPGLWPRNLLDNGLGGELATQGGVQAVAHVFRHHE